MDIRAKRKKIEKDPPVVWSLVFFISIVGLVSISYLSSDFYTPSLTGFAIQSLVDDISFSIGVDSNFENAYTAQDLTFYITVLNATTVTPITTADCTLQISTSPIEDMSYSSSLGQYTHVTTINTSGNYSYTINCDLTGIANENISEVNTIEVLSSLPDFTIQIAAPSSAETTDSVDHSITISNVGPGSYSGTLSYEAYFGDGTGQNGTETITSTTKEFSLAHTYSSAGEYTPIIIIDADEDVSETSETNNQNQTTITITEGTTNFCTTLSVSTTLTGNVYCPGGITLGEGIILDCNNYRVYGDGSASGQTGITTTNQATIRNCQIDEFGTGIFAQGALTLTNSSITDHNIGLVASSTLSTSENEFKNNNIAIHADTQTTISENDFLLNTYTLNTSQAIDISRNYFGTVTYSVIESGLQNTTPVTVIPYYDSTVRGSPSTVDPESGASISLTVTHEEISIGTEVKIKAITDEKATCRYSTTNEDYSDMKSLSSNDKLDHEKTIVFYDDETVNIYVTCLDLDDNPSSVTSSSITIRRAVDFILGNLEDEDEDLGNTIDDLKEDKENVEDDIQSSSGETLERLQEDLEEINVDINYYEILKQLTVETDDTLEVIQTNIEDIEDDHLDELVDDIIDGVQNISSLKTSISSAISSNDPDVYELFEDIIDEFKTLESNQKDNSTYEFRKRKYLNDHVLEIVVKEKKELQEKYNRYNSLHNFGRVDYLDLLDDTEEEIDQKQEEIDEYNETLQLFELETELEHLEERKEHKENYQSEMSLIIDQMEEREDYADDNDLNELKSNVERLILEATLVDEELEESIEDLESDIEKLEETIDDFDFESGSSTNQETQPSEVTFHHDLRISWTSNQTETQIETDFNEINLSLVRLAAVVTSETNNNTYLDIRTYFDNPRSDPTDIFTFEWFLIEQSTETVTTNLELYFNVSEERISELGTTFSNIRIFEFDGTWSIRETEILSSTTPYQYKATLPSVGQFALGYISPSSEVNTSCEPLWECSEFGDCNEGIRTRVCVDLSGCVEEETIEEGQCGEEIIDNNEEPGESCSDGLHNQDEEGIDCGGSCPEKCNVEESPTNIAPEKKSKGFLLFLIFLVVIASVGLFVAKGPVLKQIQQTKTKGNNFNTKIVDFVIGKLFMYESLEEIKKQLEQNHFAPEEIEHYLKVVKYTHHHFEKEKKIEPIIETFTNLKWDPKLAREIIKYIGLQILVLQIKEFQGTGESQSDSDSELIKELFVSEGYDPKLVAEAYELFKKGSGKRK